MDIYIKRLSNIKQLYKIAVAQSHQHENVAVFSILSFHDSIEMFLKLLAEKKDINSSKIGFLEYWDKIPELSLKESMRNLNVNRVNIKHKGIFPAKLEIERSRVHATDFFEQNTKRQFGLEFNEISLLELVSYPIVRAHVKAAVEALEKEDVNASMENVSKAFSELLNTYESSKSYRGSSPFFFGESTTFLSSFHLEMRDSEDSLGKLPDFIDTVAESIEALQDAVKIISLGIDYKEYSKFRFLAPVIYRTTGGNMISQQLAERNLTTDNCQYCIDFVINCALKLQEFDFDVNSLVQKPT